MPISRCGPGVTTRPDATASTGGASGTGNCARAGAPAPHHSATASETVTEEYLVLGTTYQVPRTVQHRAPNMVSIARHVRSRVELPEVFRTQILQVRL